MPAILYGLLAIGLGFLFLFFGIRLFRTILSTTGFIFASVLTYIIIANLRDHYQWGVHGDLYTFLFCLGTGIIGAMLSLSLWMLALIGMGCLAGFSTALYCLSWQTAASSTSTWMRPMILGGATAIGGFLAVIYERAIVMVATALVGAVAVSSGIDVFARTGFNEGLEHIIRNRGKAELNSGMYALLCSGAGMALLGLLIQAFVTGSEIRKPHQHR